MGGLVWFDKIFQACQGPTSFIAYERGLVIFEHSHIFRSGGSLMKAKLNQHKAPIINQVNISQMTSK
jgi:hypothetical protein